VNAPSPGRPDLGLAALPAALSSLGLELRPEQHDLLGRYVELLLDWNSRINLVSRRDTGRLASYHIVDSLAAARYLPTEGTAADIGAGAGLPGIPLAICRPELSVVLVESSYKKSVFLRTAVEALSLAQVRVETRRAEELAPLGCDVVLGRQTGPVKETLAWCSRHCRPGGLVVLYKTAESVTELRRSARALARSGLAVERVDAVDLPLTGVPRRFALLRRN
jgi:16S rRNA (guanine527-N7)-methyltransferase